jgi:hypothetical protein
MTKNDKFRNVLSCDLYCNRLNFIRNTTFVCVGDFYTGLKNHQNLQSLKMQSLKCKLTFSTQKNQRLSVKNVKLQLAILHFQTFRIFSKLILIEIFL